MIHVDRNNLEASVCKESFLDFFIRFWDTIVPEKLVLNWHIEIMCFDLQKIAERVFKGLPKEYDEYINVPPGSTKSTVVSIMFPAWVWTRMPSARFICGSYAYMLSMDLARRCRGVILSDKYRSLFPNVILSDDQNAKGHFQNTEGGMRFCTATDGSATGMHGHFILVDDPVDPKGAASETEIKEANTWMAETLSQRKVDKAVSATVCVQQRLHQNDATGVALDKLKKNPEAKVRHLCLPAELSSLVKPERLRRFYKDGLLDPKRMPRSVLTDAKETLGQYGYAAQYDQCPIPPGGGMFKTQRIKIDIPSKPFTHVVRYWDKAGTEGGGAFTVGAKMAVDTDKRYWVLDVVRGQWDSDERERVIVTTAGRDGRDVVVGLEQEPGSGGKESAEMTTRRLAGFRVKVQRPTGDKVLRADPYSVQVNAGNVSLRQGNWNEAYIEELTYFPRSTYKDQVDGSSGAFSLLTHQRKVVGAFGR